MAAEDNRAVEASRLRILARRAFAALVLAALAGVAWFLFARDSGDDENGPDRPPGVSAKAGKLVRGLNREEQVDQVLLLGFEGTSVPPVVRERQLGGVLVSPQNGVSETLMRGITKAGEGGGRIPPLVVAAQEGGIYRSFPELPPTSRAIDIGDTGSPEQAQAWAAETARALRAAGFHLNLFPVADVATLDSPVGGRAFSDDALLAAELTAAALRGCRAERLACAPLHFPGLGAASQDTADGPATVSLDPASLAARDLEPFQAAVAERAPGLVISLALYSAYDAVTPGALAPAVVDGLLREELGFKGVAITDDLGAGAVKATYRVHDAAVAALRAGSDLIQVVSPADQGRVREALLAAVESGEVSSERLAQAAARVLDMKRELGLLPE
jgi:beta-N-acetylhexosaminidase